MSVLPTPASSAAGDLVAWAAARLAAASDTARLDAELLLAASAGIERAAVIAHPERTLGAAETARLAAAVRRRSGGEPVAYIVGCKEFYGLPLAVDRAVLVPRPETELLVDAALERLAAGARSAVLDLGTGSGAIALALKRERPGLSVTAVDRSEAALGVARRNAVALGIEVGFFVSDWFAALGGRRFDMIVANPPYVASSDPHFGTALGHEPRIALDGGADGLDAFRAILAGAALHLTPRGALLLEHGFDQRGALAELARAHAFALERALDDLAGRPRVACFTRARA